MKKLSIDLEMPSNPGESITTTLWRIKHHNGEFWGNQNAEKLRGPLGTLDCGLLSDPVHAKDGWVVSKDDAWLYDDLQEASADARKTGCRTSMASSCSVRSISVTLTNQDQP